MRGSHQHLIVIMPQLTIKRDYIRIEINGHSIRDGWKPIIEESNNV